ncbi:hypothetical protein [Actinomadura sp. 6N118]|uniref:hypothetical protein n=1 Tax=Actinomadura sp. 6N118 TaxID=3375151 RepID=UPI003787FDF8
MPSFNAFLYTLDLLLPIISFGQENASRPRGLQQGLSAAMITAGWILATTVLARLTRALPPVAGPRSDSERNPAIARVPAGHQCVPLQAVPDGLTARQSG